MTAPVLSPREVREEILRASAARLREQRGRPRMVLFDGNWTWDERLPVRGEIMGEAEELLNETGTARVRFLGSHRVLDWIDSRHDEEDIHVVIDQAGVRWSGIADDVIERGTDDGKEYIEISFISEFEHMKRVVCYPNPFLPAEFQFPKLFSYAGPSIFGIKTLLHLNLLRRFGPLWALPEDLFNPENWQTNLNPANWPIVVVPGHLLTDTSMWTILTTRMGIFHDVIAPTLADAQLRLTCTRWLPGDPQPAPDHFTLTQPTLVVDVINQSGYVGPSGTAIDGLLHFVRNVASDFINEIDTEVNGIERPEYKLPGFLGTIDEPWVCWRNAHQSGVSGISSWERHRKKHTASAVVTGGHSPDWVNAGLKLLINGVLGFIGAIFGNPGLALGIFDHLVEDVILAFHRVANPFRQARMGVRGPPLGEVFESTGGTGFSLEALQAIRTGFWRSKALSTYKFTARNGAPYWIGRHFTLGSRVAFEVGRRKKLQVERVHTLKIVWDRGQDGRWVVSIGDDKPIDQPGAMLARQVQQVRAIAQSIGVSS